MHERMHRQLRELRDQHDRVRERQRSTNVTHSTVSPKWTKKQDQKLKQAVQKYGTQWSLISKKYRFERSVNSLVKRWHGKLKQQVQKGNTNQNNESSSQPEQQQVNESTKKIKKQQKKELKQSLKNKKQAEQSVQEQENGNSQVNSQSNNEQEQESGQDIDEGQSSIYQSKQAEPYLFQHAWKHAEDILLRDYILNDRILDWEELSTKLKISPVKQIKKRWQKFIYPSIVETRRIGGCVKYSEQEDAILSRGVKLGLSIHQLRKFLPSRTLYSLDARRRRTLRIDEEQIPDLRYWIKRVNAYKFVQKRHQHIEKPLSQDSYVYRSQSE